MSIHPTLKFPDIFSLAKTHSKKWRKRMVIAVIICNQFYANCQPRILNISFDYLEGCETGKGACKPLLVKRKYSNEKWIISYPSGGTQTDVYLKSDNGKISKHASTRSEDSNPVIDISGLPDGIYRSNMVSCGLGGSFELRIFTESQSNRNPFAYLACDSIIFYDFAGAAKTERRSIINRDSTLNTNFRKSFKADPATVKKFNEMLGKDASFGNGTASCFNPHLGIVYFFGGKPSAWIDICLDCNRLEPSLPLQSMNQGEQQSSTGIYYIANGMSPAFRYFINTILIRNGFSHTTTGKGLFD